MSVCGRLVSLVLTRRGIPVSTPVQDAILDRLMKRNAQEANEAAMRHASLLENIYIPEDANANDQGTLVHYLQPHDTLAGVCVKYCALGREGKGRGVVAVAAVAAVAAAVAAVAAAPSKPPSAATAFFSAHLSYPHPPFPAPTQLVPSRTSSG